MRLKTLAFLTRLLVCLPLSIAVAQEKVPVKFGKVSPEDFDLSKSKFDPEAGAVVIADVGNSSFEGNTKGWFSLIYQRKKRIKILRKSGMDAASESIVLYTSGTDEEKLQNLKASTYNLEGGKVIQTRLDESSIFKEKLSKKLTRQKFTFPAVKEGSIIELSYTINSDFLFNLQPWEFQCEFPTLWSEYQVEIPQFFNYVYLPQGYIPFTIDKSTSSFKNYNVLRPNEHPGMASENLTVSGNLSQRRWVIANAPALKEEKFTSTLHNYVSKVEFQLSQYRFPEVPVKDIMGNWLTATEELMKSEEFGVPVQNANNWLNDDMRGIVTKSATPLQKAKQIYNYVRDNFTCTNYNGLKIASPLRQIFARKNGSVADINLLLTAMLRHEDLEAAPVILSTKSNGYTIEMYPVMDRFNYVITELLIDGDRYYLDATRQLGFGKLSTEIYNGGGRVISKTPVPVYFSADSLKETKLTSVFIINGEKGEIIGQSTSQLGFVESERLRENIKKNGKDAFLKKIEGAYNGDVTVKELALDSLKDLENIVSVRYDFEMKPMKDELVYFSPLMTEGMKENLFKAAERYYPVEMPCAMDEVFILNMEVPTGYAVDEMPKSTKVNFNDNEGYFEYIISKNGADRLQLRTRIMLNKANFAPDDYASLRDFFGYIVKKHSEQVVFKKVK
jgi:transglutaminase-like putative cysteine protease